MRSHDFRPEIQARKQADARNPEVQRRREIYRKARGDKKRRVANWNVAWNVCGRPADFPEFDAWDAMTALEHVQLEMNRRV